MAVTNPSTANVSTTVPSPTGFTVNVTACNLNSNLSEKDFVVLVNGNVNANTNWNKTNQTTLTYVGGALTPGVSLVVQRKTPPNLLKLATFGSRISSAEYNDELERRARIDYEIALNGAGGGGGGGGGGLPPLDDPFGASWNGDVTYSATRNALYDHIVGLAPLNAPAFTGNPTATTQTLTDNSTRLATTAFVQGNLATYAPLASPAFTGNPTAATQTGTNNTTRLATTAFAHIASVTKQIRQARAGSAVSVTGTSQQTLVTLSVTPRSSTTSFLVIASSEYLLANSSDSSYIRVRCGATTVGATTVYNLGTSSQNASHITILGVFTPGSASAFTVTFEGNANGTPVVFGDGAHPSAAQTYPTIHVIEFENLL